MAENQKFNLEINVNTKDGEKNIDKLSDKTQEATKSAKQGQGAFSSLGNTIKSLGVVTAIAGAFNFFKDALSKNQVVADSVAAVFNTISTIISTLVDIFIDVTSEVGKNTNGFAALGKVLSGVFTLAVTPLKLAFDGLKLVINEIQLAWEKSPLGDKDQKVIKELTENINKTKDSLKDTGKNAVEAGKDIFNNFGEAASSVVSVVSGVVNKASKINVAAVYEQSKATIALRNNAKIAEAQLEGLVEKYDRQAEQLRQIRDDEFKSVDERIAANNKLAEVLNEQEQAQKKLAQTKVASAAADLAQNKTNTDLQAALIKAQNGVAAVEAQVAGLRSEQLANSVALTKEKIAIDASLAASTNKIALDQRKINADLIKDEVLKQTTKKQIAEEEAALELKRLQDNINNTKAGTQARVDAEIAFAEKKAEISNQITTLDAAIAQAKLDKEAKVRADTLALAQADYELNKALGEATFQDQFVLYDQRRELERKDLAARKATAAELEAFDKQTAAGKIALERAVQDQKLAILNNGINTAIEIVGKESAAGKALSIAQAVMNTYTGATRALKDVPFPFNFVAAGSTIAQGLLSVKKIISTPLPGVPGGAGSGASANLSASAPVAPPQPQAQTTTLDSQSINALGSQTSRAYVVESDVTSSQQRIAAIQQRARFG
jgi:hypothetical protein